MHVATYPVVLCGWFPPRPASTRQQPSTRCSRPNPPKGLQMHPSIHSAFGFAHLLHLRYPSTRSTPHPSIHPPFIGPFLPPLHILTSTGPRIVSYLLPPSLCSSLRTADMSSTPFKGSLKAKRKGELTEIAQALGIGLDQSQKKEELEDLIREHLISHKNQYSSNESFKGLIDSLDSGRSRRSARSSSVNGNA